MADEALEAATAEALAARDRGDIAAMNYAFDAAKQISESRYPTDGEAAKAAPSGNGESVTPEVLDEVRQMLIASGDPEYADARLPHMVQDYKTFADGFDRQNPGLGDELMAVCDANPTLKPLLFKIGAALGRQAPQAAAPATPSRAPNPDASYAPVAPILSAQEAIQAQIDALEAEHFGKESYKSKAVQSMRDQLYARLYGSQPAVGHGQRWV